MFKKSSKKQLNFKKSGKNKENSKTLNLEGSNQSKEAHIWNPIENPPLLY